MVKDIREVQARRLLYRKSRCFEIAAFITLCLAIAACTNSSLHDTTHKASPVDTSRRITKNQKSIANSRPTSNNDTLLVDRKAAVFVEPDSLRIETRKKQIGEENFYTGADDYMFYISSAHNFLDSVHLTTLSARGKKFIKFIRNDKTHQTISLDKLPELWNIYLFDPEKKAKPVDMIIIDEEYESYFK